MQAGALLCSPYPLRTLVITVMVVMEMAVSIDTIIMFHCGV